MKSYFVFDVESIGLHGEGFAVGGGVFVESGDHLLILACQRSFAFACPSGAASGSDSDRQWVDQNVPDLEVTHQTPNGVRDAFWKKWIEAKADGATMAADCLWPVEANFVLRCVKDNPERQRNAPYPFLEVASFLQAAGLDPLNEYARMPSELTKHDPLCDAMQSARMLAMALDKLKR